MNLILSYYSSELLGEQGKPAKIGEWGGNAGDRRDVRATPDQLIQVKVTADNSNCIRSISFIYIGADGKPHEEGPWGFGHAGTEYKVCECSTSIYCYYYYYPSRNFGRPQQLQLVTN